MTTIPASQLVRVNPSVLGAGGNSIDVIGLMLTTSIRVPIGTVQSFPSLVAVQDFFGPGSDEALLAAVYFGGFDEADAIPASVLFAQYNEADVAAYLRGGDVSSLTLAQLQGITGTLTVTIDGYARILSSLNLSAATSFSSAAGIIETAINALDPQEAAFTAALGGVFTATGTGTSLAVTAVTGKISIGDTVTGTGVPADTTITAQPSGTPGGAGTYTTSAITTAAAASCVALSTNLVVSAVASGTLSAGQTLLGAGVAGSPVITSQASGTEGGIGTYVISGSQQHIASESMTSIATDVDVLYDSVSGAFVVTSGITGSPSTAAFATGTTAASLKLTSATGAVVSQGAVAAVPATFMDAVVLVTTDWVTFMTTFDPDAADENTVKLAFAAWVTDQNDRYAYICSDSDLSPTLQAPATTSLGDILRINENSGTVPVWEPGQEKAAFICGVAASIDFLKKDGRITFAYKGQTGLSADVTNGDVAENLAGDPQVTDSRGNGYNFYGAYGAANQSYVNLQRGFVTGDFLWLDSYINQIWLNNSFQVAMLDYMTKARSIPYSPAGYSILDQVLADPIAAGLNFGAFGPGTISRSQQTQVNQAAGVDIANTLQTQGYYLQILDADATVRTSRGSPPIKFWYLDRGSIQAIDVSSIAVQ